jgi:hypothetical protein
MATTIETRIRIAASPEKVWNILTDFASYPDWNPFVRSLEGEVKTGSRIRVKLVPPGQKGMVFRPRVLAFDDNRRFEWLGHLAFPGIFDGAHSFGLISHEDGTTTLVQAERFRGILVPFMKKMLNGSTLAGFRQMNEALKERAEQ